MFRQFIDSIRRYYAVIVLPKELFTDNNEFTLEQKRMFVSQILSKPSNRELLERYVRWKVGVHTRAAMRSADEKETSKFKERAYGVAEQTIDFKNFWEAVKADDARKDEEAKEKVKLDTPFRVFGNDEYQE